MQIWGFINGTFKGICCLKENQKRIYLNYKKKHNIKWQSIIILNNIINLQKLYKKYINNWKIYYKTKIKVKLKTIS